MIPHMAKSPKRRIVQWAVLGVTLWMLVLAVYAGGYGCTYWMLGRGAITAKRHANLEASIFAPASSYAMSESPGGLQLWVFAHWCMFHGHKTPVPWSEVEKMLRAGKEGRAYSPPVRHRAT
jgi:hypothetical protein